MTASLETSGLQWAFNPCYININGGGDAASVKLGIGENTIQVYLVDGSARVYISRLLQLLFNDTWASRFKTTTVTLDGVPQMTIDVVWGSKAAGEKNGISDEVVYFEGFPFEMDIYSTNSITHTTDMATIVKSVKVFHRRTEKEGVYLRWIDHQGGIRFFLFTDGSLTNKTNPTEQKKVLRNYRDGFYSRPLEVTNTRTMKVAATDVPCAVLDYVQDICSSPMVDMLVSGNWVPISVSGGSYSYPLRHTLLHELEIEITLPNTLTQTL